jgi:uncharacterized protein YjbI with pentapeptide repeats
MRRVDVLRGWRQRWSDPEVKPVARQLAGELKAGAVRTASPFGVVEGRVDLRGLQADLLNATRDPMYERTTVGAGQWSALDLSGAGLSGLNWTDLHVSDCVLDDAQLDSLRCWGVHVSDCSAQRASLEYAQIGALAEGFKRSAWRRVDLRGADLRRSHGNVVLEDVDLRRAMFVQTDFGWSDLNRVRFAGTVRGLTIGDLHAAERPATWILREVNFSEAKPEGLRLVAVNLGSSEVDIRLPDDDEYRVIRDWPAFLDRVAANAPEDVRSDAEIWVDYERRGIGPNQTWGFIGLKSARRFRR